MIEWIVGNCIEIMKGYEDNEFDLCLTDPPYNIGQDYGEFYDDNKSYEEFLEFSKAWMTEAMRVSKALILSTGFTMLKMYLCDIQYPDSWLCWFHKTARGRMHNTGAYIHWEPMLVYGKVKLGKSGFHYPVENYRYIGDGKGRKEKGQDTHSCGKPRNLYIDVLKECYWGKGKKGNGPKRVLDPMIGSGTTAMACKVLGIDCVGIDINPDYIREAKENIKMIQYGEIDRWFK